MNKVSNLQIGWVMVRSSKVGKASKILKKMGFWKQDPADVNNRHGANWIKPTMTREQFESMDFRPLADAGLVGIAFWITDAQWGQNAAMTDLQWQNRATIDQAFNAQWPNGRRAA